VRFGVREDRTLLGTVVRCGVRENRLLLGTALRCDVTGGQNTIRNGRALWC
jgi:hypothetical protein